MASSFPLLPMNKKKNKTSAPISLASTPPMSSSPGPLTNPQQQPPPPESLDGLKFGQKIYFEDGTLSSTNTQTKTTPSSKKGRVGSTVQAAQPPRCQVEGCKVDLSDAKAYYSRHKVCGMHSKSPTVIVAGLEQRFCQQCSRFHRLPEFDQGKRSCRRRLAGHNERRRKPPPSSLLTSRYSKLSSPIFDYYGGRGGGFLMEFAPYPKLTARNVFPTPKSSQPVSENQTATLSWQANSETPSDFFLQGSVGGTSSPGPRHPPVGSYTGVADPSCALSLLSSQTWGPRNMTPSVELNNLFNFNGTPTTQLAAPTSHVAAVHQLPNALWCCNGVDSDNCSHEAVPDVSLGQNPQPPQAHLPGELEEPHQGRRLYMDLGQSRAYESSRWSL